MKLGAHIMPIHWSGADDEQLRRLQPKSVKVVDSDPNRLRSFHQMCPNSLFVLRDWALSEQHGDVSGMPDVTGARHAAEWWTKLDNWKWPIPRNQLLVEGQNEPPVWIDGMLDATVRYNVAFLDKLKELGLRGIALNLGVGWPTNSGADTPPVWTPYEPVRAAILRGNHYLGLHEYWSKDGVSANWGWWAGRYTKCPWQVPILMSECGLDQYVTDTSVGQHRRGWNAWLNADQYRQQVMDYEARIAQDKRIHSACIFTWDYS